MRKVTKTKLNLRNVTEGSVARLGNECSSFCFTATNVIRNFSIGDILQYFNSRLYYVQKISKNMTETSETKVCRLCACDSIDNKNIFDESEDLLIKLRTTFSLVVSKFSYT